MMRVRHHGYVRTTITLDPDVAAKIRERMSETRASFQETVNEALRAGLMEAGRQRAARPFVVKARALGLRPGLTYDHTEELLDQLDGPSAGNQSASTHDERARTWRGSAFSGVEQVGLPWTVIFGFIPIGTDARVHTAPFTMAEIIEILSEWLARDNVFALSPGPRHWDVVCTLLLDGQAPGPLLMDAHIAAHAIEHGAALVTNDRDFARFKGLRTLNPLAG